MLVDAEYYDPEDIQTVQEFKDLFEWFASGHYLIDRNYDWEQLFAKISSLARSKHTVGRLAARWRGLCDEEKANSKSLEQDLEAFRANVFQKEWAYRLVRLAEEISGETYRIEGDSEE